MGFLDKLKFWKKDAPSPAPAPTVPVVVPLPPGEILGPMTQEEIQAEIGRLVVLIPQCSTEYLKTKYQRKLEALVAAAQG